MQTKLSRTKAIYLLFIFILLLFSSLPSLTKASLKCNSIEECKKLFEESAKSFLGASYSYGSMGKSGFDCSGLVLTMANKLINHVNLPRRSQDMYSMLTENVTLDNAKMGDLIFFNTGKGVSHVGLYWGKDNKNRHIMYHTSYSKGVELRILDGNKYWMSRLVGIKRFIPLTNAISVLGSEDKLQEKTQKKTEKASEKNSLDTQKDTIKTKNKIQEKELEVLKNKEKVDKAANKKTQNEAEISIVHTEGKLTEKPTDKKNTNLDDSCNNLDFIHSDKMTQKSLYITAGYEAEIDLPDNYQYVDSQEHQEDYEYEIIFE